LSKKVVSMDIGSRSIHVLEGATKGKLVKIKKAFSFPTPPSCLMDGKIEDKGMLKETLKAGFRNNRMRSKNAIISVQSSAVIIRDLVLPAAQKQEQLAGAVAYEMEQYVSVDGRNNVTEFKVVDEVIEDGVAKNKIRVATMPKEMIENYYKLTKEVKLRPYALDVHSNAISKLFSNEFMINDEKYIPETTIAVADFGYKTTMINIITRGVLEFSRLLNYGSRDIDLIISNYFNLTPGEAEAKKMDEIDFEKIDSAAEGPDSIYSSLKSSFTQLSKELQKVIQYYTSRSSSNNVDTMYIYGGGAKVKGMDAYLKQLLNLNRVIRIENISSADLIFDVENLEIDTYINALGAMIRL
jgi:type IV pilus assembly protein PilM